MVLQFKMFALLRKCRGTVSLFALFMINNEHFMITSSDNQHYFHM